MKKLILLLVFVPSLFSVKAQDNCSQSIETASKENLKKKVEQYVKRCKNSALLSTELKNEVEQEYKDLQEQHNLIYQAIRNDIANGYLFIGERRLCKTEYYSKLNDLEDKTKIFLAKKRDLSSLKNIEIHNTKSVVNAIGFETVFSGLWWIMKKLEKISQDKADRFYKKVGWESYQEI